MAKMPYLHVYWIDRFVCVDNTEHVTGNLPKTLNVDAETATVHWMCRIDSQVGTSKP